jgi:hypothetical protein
VVLENVDSFFVSFRIILDEPVERRGKERG